MTIEGTVPAPTVDVLVSTFNEERYLGRCLEYVLGQDYPADRFRVLLLDGGSTDATVEVARGFAANDARVEIVADGRRRNLPESLNLARAMSSADLVAKVDAHGYPERDFLRLCAEGFNGGGASVGCVGGRPVQEGETDFGRAVALARSSRFGVGGSDYAGASTRALVNTVQCGVYRRDVLDEVGWFDPVMNFGEDEELNWRIRKAGYDILLDGRVRFHYVTRPTWKAAYRQYRNYGEARVRVVDRHPGFLKAHHLAPAGLVSGATGLAGASLASRRARWALAALGGAYVGAAAVAAVRAARRGDTRDTRLAGHVAACFVALHTGYGVGTLRGLRARFASRDRLKP